MGGKWFDASIACLHLSRYMAKAHINSIQTILVLTLAAHILGHSSEIFTLLGVAMRLAQSLSLHKLSHNNEMDSLETTTGLQKDAIRKRELGRRVWSQLRIHDSCSVLFTDMCVLASLTWILLINGQVLHTETAY